MNTFSNRIIADYATLQAKGKDSAVREASSRRLQRLIGRHLGRSRQHALDLGAGQGELVEALQLCNERLEHLSSSGLLDLAWIRATWKGFEDRSVHWKQAWTLVVLGEFARRVR